MSIYVNLFFLAVVVVYIVDLSGFTQSWRGAVARLAGISPSRLRPLPPFDCGQCATWWACLVWALCAGELSLPVVAYCAALAFLTGPLGQLALLVRETAYKVVRQLMKHVER